jgi:hypothetical protein
MSNYLILFTISEVNADWPMEEHTFKNVNNYLNTNVYSNLETSGGKSCNIYLTVVHFFNTNVK